MPINEIQKQIIKLISKNIDELDERWPEYKEGLLIEITDIIQLQKDFELKVSGSVVPKITEKIDVFAQEFDDQ
jgi:hypothetical protein